MSSMAQTQQFAEALQRKHALLLQVRALGSRQSQLIEEGNLGELLKLLAVKQGLIGQLQGLQQALLPLRQDQPHAHRWSDEATRAHCARQVAECEQLLAEILRQEKLGETLLQARRDEAAHRLAGAHWASEARGAYEAGPGAPNAQLDLSSGD